ncbi:uncharacterized protein B0I36DRAFT_101030 [Microdochium trichocladiopsis]|uniref:Uncharacterized protein n=1 Tax=Microdochium trichocladiopsis TaxID=1682393 RepID=A0A9P8YAW3_9PEZI|nr:uncharacterized protein B0I36DRAFT_101030 [Microdochium trichocladiopsis]KAH7032827.1 hypothetical protein B0I36DRAFT_101030 [Microdochium trichocladiopsis]
MSPPISPPPQQSYATNLDEVRLPRGQCRYILLNPEIKGQRCACICFTLNHDHPGVVCQCGHQSCYHLKDLESPTGTSEVERLRQRVQALERQLDRDYQGGIGGDLGMIVKRLGELEEMVERHKEEAAADIKGCYRNVSRTWQSIDQVAKRQKLQDTILDERLDDHADNISRLDERFRELNEASISLEERIESLEEPRSDMDAPQSTSSSPSQHTYRDPISPIQPRVDSSRKELHPTLESETRSMTNKTRTVVTPSNMTGPVQDWTVHVSLLPSISQPFPFEKDTRAYKRCLSRGLHQMIAVSGRDGQSFVSAVSSAFSHVLQGREWVPFHARLCDTHPLAGLPMLRPLDPTLAVPHSYTHEFLVKHCAVMAADGRIDSLYIALRHNDLTWEELRAAPVFLKGLESSWDHDPRLAPASLSFSCQPASSPTPHFARPVPKKRHAAEMSQGSEPYTDLQSAEGPRTTPATALVNTTADTRTVTTEGSDSEDYARAAKVPRTNYDLPVSLKMRPHGEATAIA